jgi:hypothetical protein
MVTPLFTKTGITPTRVRHLQLVLQQLIYFLELDNKHHARAALNSSLELSAKGVKECWASELITAAARLPLKFPGPVLNATTSIEDVQNYAKLVDKLMLEWLQDMIDSSEKMYLLD